MANNNLESIFLFLTLYTVFKDMLVEKNFSKWMLVASLVGALIISLVVAYTVL